MSYSHYPRRPVKSFQDLEVYQKVQQVAVVVSKRLESETGKNRKPRIRALAEKAMDLSLSLPVLIATAHSIRFADQEQAVDKLEKAMLNCNLAVVYLEQFRDLGNHKIEAEFFEEQIKSLLSTRMKIMHLQMSWKKFIVERQREGK